MYYLKVFLGVCTCFYLSWNEDSIVSWKSLSFYCIKILSELVAHSSIKIHHYILLEHLIN